MLLSQETIDDIRSSANIVDVIGHYIPLIKKGKNYTAVCPFHDDHDPSLSISVDKQIYKCFVCGNGGNCFTFVQNYKKCSFIEAVVEVANIIGKPLNIDYIAPKKVNKYQHYYDLLKDYIEYTNYVLSATKLGLEAKEYLNKRGIDEEIINEFGIGFNPKDNRVYQSLKAKSYSDEDMIKVNIGRMTNSGMADVFVNRITFPIHDKDGNPLAFTARDYLGISDSKYINTAETLIYTKGKHLYNYHRAKDSSKQLGSVIVCEGVMDVIAYKRAGIHNVVATLGTACTSEQIELFKQISKKIVLSYDGDKAGIAANLKIGELLLNEGITVEVIDNNTELDPDEIINKYDKNALRDLSSRRLSFIDYALKHYKEKYNLENYEDRKTLTFKIADLIDKLTDEYDKENYRRELYELTKIRKVNTNVTNKIEYNRLDRSYNDVSLDGLTKAEFTILLMMSMDKNAKDIYQKELGCLLNEDNNKLANLEIDEYRKHDACKLAKLYDEVEEQALKNLIINLGTVDSLADKYDEELFKGAIAKVKEEIKKRKLDDLRSKIAKSEAVDPEKTKAYLVEYTELLKELGGK